MVETTSTLQRRATPTGRELIVPHDGVIVSKTDPSGVIVYANELFREFAGYSEEELLGAPHNLVRHPDMPRAVFALLWDELQAGREVFAYVVNLAKSGDHHWVFAHITPTLDDEGRPLAFHSTRRHAEAEAVAAVAELYGRMRSAEHAGGPGRRGIDAGLGVLEDELQRRGLTYEQLVFSLTS